MNVTNGTVEFERVVRPADFESKRVRVTMSYAVDDGEDPAQTSARVGDMAHAEVFRMLAKKEQANAAPAAVKPPKVETPKEVAQADPITSTDTSASLPTPSPSETPTEAKPITDVDLDVACRGATKRLNGNAEQTKATIKQFLDDGQVSVRQVSQEKRPALLAALNALGQASA